MNNMYFNIKVKKMSIWNIDNIVILVIELILTTLLTCGLILMILQEKRELISFIMEGLILLIFCIISIIYSLKHAILKKNKYNYLVENGEIKFGNITYAHNLYGRASVSASIFDDNENKLYLYRTVASGIWLLKGIRLNYYAKNYPQIPILVDKNHIENGCILINEYFKQMKLEHGDEMYQKENYFDSKKWFQ